MLAHKTDDLSDPHIDPHNKAQTIWKHGKIKPQNKDYFYVADYLNDCYKTRLFESEKDQCIRNTNNSNPPNLEVQNV